MTSQLSPRDEDIVDALLGELPHGSNPARTKAPADLDELELTAFRDALLEIRALAHTPAPEPSAELRAHFTGDTAAKVVDIASARSARVAKAKRACIVTAAVITTMGLGIGSAAAISPDFRQSATETITTIISTVTGAGDETPGSSGNGNSDQQGPGDEAPGGSGKGVKGSGKSSDTGTSTSTGTGTGTGTGNGKNEGTESNPPHGNSVADDKRDDKKVDNPGKSENSNPGKSSNSNPGKGSEKSSDNTSR